MLALKTIVGLLPLAALSAARFHPVIDPEISRQQISDGLSPVLGSTKSISNAWKSGWIFESCKSEAEARGFSASDMEVFNVQYSDCEEPWAMCRHMNVTSPSKDEMIDNFGRLPVHAREYVRHVIVLPDLGNSAAGLFYNYNIMFGENYMNLYVTIHETSHALDYGALRNIGSPFSNSSTWKDAYALDTASPTEYARWNWVEDFGEVGPLSFYDTYVQGGLASIQPNIAQMQHQIDTYKTYLAKVIAVGGTCKNRLPNAETVPMVSSARAMQIPTDKPDYSVKSKRVNVHDLPETPRVEVEAV